MSDVYFAGSVVPQRYPWEELVRTGCVRRVRNVVATSDWVVAIFPRLFEQIAEWLGVSHTTGYWDIGAAGFRGFRYNGEPRHAVRDFAFASGSHSTGVDIKDSHKLAALVRFARNGVDDEQDRIFAAAFKDSKAPHWLWDNLSNLSWAAWMICISIVLVGFVATWSVNPYAAAAYVLLLLAIANSF